MADKTYNGWTNYETWCANLWIDNDQGQHYHWHDRAIENVEHPDAHVHWTEEESAVFGLADEMKDYYEEERDQCDVPGMFADLLSAALSEVNWGEIAKHYIEAAKEELETT